MAMNLSQRKQALVLRSELLRRSMMLQLRPVRSYARLAENGFVLARALTKLLTSSKK